MFIFTFILSFIGLTLIIAGYIWFLEFITKYLPDSVLLSFIILISPVIAIVAFGVSVAISK